VALHIHGQFQDVFQNVFQTATFYGKFQKFTKSTRECVAGHPHLTAISP
jgi:hypothetical protein